MSEIATILAAIPSSAIPLVVIVLGLYWIYRKTEHVTNTINKDREVTKVQRDTDSQELHDKVLKLEFKTTELAGRIELHDTILGDINKQINLLNTNIAILTEKLENLTNALKDMKNDMNRSK